MRKIPELRFSSELLIMFRPLSLLFKTGGSRSRLNYARGFEHVHPQEIAGQYP